MPDAGEIHVVESDHVALFRSIGEGSLALECRPLLIDIEVDGYGRIPKLHVRNVDGVAPKRQLVAAVLEHVVRMAGSVPVGRNCT